MANNGVVAGLVFRCAPSQPQTAALIVCFFVDFERNERQLVAATCLIADWFHMLFNGSLVNGKLPTGAIWGDRCLTIHAGVRILLGIRALT